MASYGTGGSEDDIINGSQNILRNGDGDHGDDDDDDGHDDDDDEGEPEIR